MPAPKGNKFNAKAPADRAGTFLHIRCRAADKRRWQRLSVEAKLTLAKWVVETLNRRAKR